MADLNKVYLMGRVCADPELRHIASGSPVTELRVAVNESWTTKTGEKKENTEFFDVVVWDRQAETCAKYLRKGSNVHVEGKLKTDTWDDKTTGEKRSKIRITADRVQFLDRAPESGGGGGPYQPQEPQGRAPSPQPSRGGQPPRSPYQPAGPRGTTPVPQAQDDDDDIPF